MSLKIGILELIESFLEKEGLSYPEIKMLELGAQDVKFETTPRYKKAKTFFLKEKGIQDIVSVDINGEEGVVKADLTKDFTVDPIWTPYESYFNVVTNLGTSEHVGTKEEQQRACFDNVDYLCANGGLMFHGVPAVGSWNGKSHRSCYKYTNDYFEKIASRYSYKILCNEIHRENTAKELVFCVLKK